MRASHYFSIPCLAYLFATLFALTLHAQESQQGLNYAQSLSSAFESVADTATPSVVNIRAVKKVKNVSRSPREMNNDPFFDQFRKFFGDQFDFGPMQPPEGYAQEGMGTGVIVDEKGFIVTNNHVVGEADEITVRLSNAKDYKAKVIGTDPRSDIAVIKIDAPDLKASKLGDSDALKIGEWVVAAGNPFGLDNTITAGIVSAKGRSLMGGGQYEDFIQTDAAINPGNSGGPLLNLHGEVVGINTAIFSRSGGYMGIGFAIPSNMVKVVMRSLIDKGKVVRGWLGIAIQPLTPELAQSFNYPGTDGILVGDVEEKSPADQAGLKQGDIVVSFDGQKPKDINQFRNTVASKRPGDKVDVEVVREGRKKEFLVEIGELPAAAAQSEAKEELSQDIGIDVETLTPSVAKRLGIKQSKGVIVSAVQPGSVAAHAGILPRDLIISVNGRQVDDLKSFSKALESADLKNGVRLVVESQGMERFVVLKSE